MHNSAYQKETGHSAVKLLFDKGLFGEYLCSKKLDKVSGVSKQLLNVYLPKRDGTTTEVDLIYINSNGVFVIESKNYSGWIFGNDMQKYWTQSLKGGQKNKFFNPVWQNDAHANAIKSVVGDRYSGPYFNIVVFSARCELKKITISRGNTWVINRQALIRTVKNISEEYSPVLSETEIANLYEMLKNYANAGADLRQRHIDLINANK